MDLIARFFDFEKKAAEYEERLNQTHKMIDGYQMTEEPFVPEILEKAIDFKTIQSHQGFHKIGLTLAAGGSNLVDARSLETIRKRLLEVYGNGGYPEISKKLKNALPRNLIAISFAFANFEVGKSCQEFFPASKFTIPEGTFLTYRKLSENLQATYYTENGTEFLAGLCYYPVLNDGCMLLKNDDALILLSLLSREPYPLQKYRTAQHIGYGRYCQTAGKRVAVECSGKYGKVCHIEFNHFSKSWRYPACDECAVDYLTYKWDEPKSAVSPAPAPVVTTASSKLEQPKKAISPAPVVQVASKQGQPIKTPKVTTPAPASTTVSGKLEDPKRSASPASAPVASSAPAPAITDASKQKKPIKTPKVTSSASASTNVSGKLEDLKISAPVTLKSSTSSSTTKKSEVPTTSSKSMSSASSTESLLNEYDNIDA